MKVEDKSNEITAIPALLELLDITGSIITIDAMGTQTEIAQKIIEKKADQTGMYSDYEGAVDTNLFKRQRE